MLRFWSVATRSSAATWSTGVTRPSRLPRVPGRESHARTSACAWSRASVSRAAVAMGRRGYTGSRAGPDPRWMAPIPIRGDGRAARRGERLRVREWCPGYARTAARSESATSSGAPPGAGLARSPWTAIARSPNHVENGSVALRSSPNATGRIVPFERHDDEVAHRRRLQEAVRSWTPALRRDAANSSCLSLSSFIQVAPLGRLSATDRKCDGHQCHERPPRARRCPVTVGRTRHWPRATVGDRVGRRADEDPRVLVPPSDGSSMRFPWDRAR